jgi:hypothetical protein
VFLKSFGRSLGEGIAAIRDDVSVVRGAERVEYFRMNTGVVVTCEASFGHFDSCLFAASFEVTCDFTSRVRSVKSRQTAAGMRAGATEVEPL